MKISLYTESSSGIIYEVNEKGVHKDADSLSSDTWDMRDLETTSLSDTEKYMILAFECGLAL